MSLPVDAGVGPSSNGSNPNAQGELAADIAAQMKFQRRWRIFSMSAYVITTIGTLACSTGATLFSAGGSHPQLAAILAAVATILVGTEKSLLFRDKWKFHLIMFVKLNALRAKIALGQLDLAQGTDEFTKVMSQYASELPMAAREQS